MPDQQKNDQKKGQPVTRQTDRHRSTRHHGERIKTTPRQLALDLEPLPPQTDKHEAESSDDKNSLDSCAHSLSARSGLALIIAVMDVPANIESPITKHLSRAAHLVRVTQAMRDGEVVQIDREQVGAVGKTEQVIDQVLWITCHAVTHTSGSIRTKQRR